MEINPAALKAIRERSGLSQSELARQTGLGQGYISALESGARKGSPASIKTLADALVVPTTAICAPAEEVSA